MINWLNQINNAQQKVNSKHKAVDTVNMLVENFIAKPVIPASMCSFGKDSTTMLSLMLVAWKKAVDIKPQLKKLPFLVVYSDTLVEMPIKSNYMNDVITLIERYADKYKLDVKVLKAAPTTQTSWQGKIVAGVIKQWDVRLGRGNGCATSWKIKTIDNVLVKWRRLAKAHNVPLVKFIGVRDNESAIRDQRNKKTGINQYLYHENAGELTCYPVFNWSLHDIWDYLLFCENDPESSLPAISDGFEPTIRFYNSMSATECSATAGGSSNCGSSRDGCWLCFANPSMELDTDLITSNPHVEPLVEFRRYMVKNNINIFNRSYLQPRPSSIGEYKATSHSGGYLLDILRIGLTIQIREIERAKNELELVQSGLHLDPANAKTSPQFEIFSHKDIAFIDWNWAQRGLQIEPHSALRAYYDVFFLGKRFDIPTGYLRDVPYATDPSADTGVVIYEEMSFEEIDHTDKLEELSLSWEFASDNDFKQLFGRKDLLDEWLKETDHINGSTKWFEAGLIIPPKSQVKKIRKRSEWARFIYQNDLNHLAFNGGPYLKNIS